MTLSKALIRSVGARSSRGTPHRHSPYAGRVVVVFAAAAMLIALWSCAVNVAYPTSHLWSLIGATSVDAAQRSLGGGCSDDVIDDAVVKYVRTSSNIRREIEAATKQRVADDGWDDVDEDDSDQPPYHSGLSLTPGEMPGYTGWSRPEKTLAGHFRIVPDDRNSTKSLRRSTVSGEPWSVKVACSAQECSNGGSLFFVRAYGPAVITGRVHDEHDGSYRIELFPVDAGRYTVEVVLTFSHPPKWEEFPMGLGQTEPGYEGYMIPGFPLQLTVTPPLPSQSQSRLLDTGENVPAEVNELDPPASNAKYQWCTVDHLTERDSESGLEKGRWLVVDRVQDPSHQPITPDATGVSLPGYQVSLNALGARMQYVPIDCDMLSVSDILTDDVIGQRPNHILDQCMSDVMGGVDANGSQEGTDPIHIIFIGDSVMRLEKSFFDKIMERARFRNVKTTLVETLGGLEKSLEEVRSELDSLRNDSPDERRFILYNAGLHDIDSLCCTLRSSTREKMWGNATDDSNFVCVEHYRKRFAELTSYLGQYPSDLLVFRSTTAGWHKYGNYGFSWPSAEMQLMSRSPNFVSHMNEIAFQVISASGYNISIIDGYWITLARPDHTEANKDNARGKHLAHPGMEVFTVLSRKWFMVVLWRLCSSTLYSWKRGA